MQFVLYLPKNDVRSGIGSSGEKGDGRSARRAVQKCVRVRPSPLLSAFPNVKETSTVQRYGRGATRRCASARCVLRGF
eukprot:6177907-Pleurochrysis_carterae.AAC.1